MAVSILYQDSDSRVYLEASEVRSRYVAELTVYTSNRVEKKVKETIFKEVASGLLVSKMDIKAIQTKVGTKTASGFLLGLSL